MVRGSFALPVMVFTPTSPTDAELRATLSQARVAYEQETTTQSPPILTENLDAETLWEAENRLLERVPAHVSEHGCIEDRELLENVVLWKFGPGVGMIRDVPPADVAAVTRRALQSDTAPAAIEILGELDGIADSMAGAVLTFVNPQRYTVMDPRATRALSDLGFWALDHAANADQYETYCLRCQELGNRTGLSLRDVDRALFVLGGED